MCKLEQSVREQCKGEKEKRSVSWESEKEDSIWE